ncbi:MAG: dockerin type I domain-containing protein [Bacteroidales bacterium]|nr:dockerin type I domain-containing protein [Bacteroidales bacterium]
MWKNFQNIWDDYEVSDVNDKKGDVNGDGVVNVTDVTAVINIILGN